MPESSPQTAHARDAVVPLASRGGFELAIRPRAEKTIGHVIADPHSSHLIADTRIEPLELFADDRGFFAEIARLGKGLAQGMLPGGDRNIQFSFTLSYPGTIKAIHYHFEQTDLWAPVAGMIQVALFDFRHSSPTFGAINTLYVGQLRPWKILIPPGVGHGYKVVGAQPAQLIYVTDRHYNPDDEGRLAYNHPAVGYDWETQHK